jgi:ABC-2 type transport system permease protein
VSAGAVTAPAPRAPVGEQVDTSGLGRPIRGPSALTDDWARFWHLTFNIARTQWKLRFFGSALGYLWQLMRPLLLFAVMWIFFIKIAQINKGSGPADRYFGTQLLGSIVLFTFFAEATTRAVRSVVDSENLVRKIQFPRLVIPLSGVLLSLFNLALNLIVVLIFGLIEGVRPMLTWLELPLIIAMLAVLATGLSMLLSSMFVYFRDIEPIWEVASQVLFYASPVIISIAHVEKKLSATLVKLYMLNPLATILQQFRHAMVTHTTPSSGALLGSRLALLEPIAVVVGIFVLGFYVFNRTAPRVAENL